MSLQQFNTTHILKLNPTLDFFFVIKLMDNLNDVGNLGTCKLLEESGMGRKIVGLCSGERVVVKFDSPSVCCHDKDKKYEEQFVWFIRHHLCTEFIFYWYRKLAKLQLNTTIRLVNNGTVEKQSRYKDKYVIYTCKYSSKPRVIVLPPLPIFLVTIQPLPIDQAF